jgi:hypothetical protein
VHARVVLRIVNAVFLNFRQEKLSEREHAAERVGIKMYGSDIFRFSVRKNQ